jgi:hypothetical protein
MEPNLPAPLAAVAATSAVLAFLAIYSPAEIGQVYPGVMYACLFVGRCILPLQVALQALLASLIIWAVVFTDLWLTLTLLARTH